MIRCPRCNSSERVFQHEDVIACGKCQIKWGVSYVLARYRVVDYWDEYWDRKQDENAFIPNGFGSCRTFCARCYFENIPIKKDGPFIYREPHPRKVVGVLLAYGPRCFAEKKGVGKATYNKLRSLLKERGVKWPTFKEATRKRRRSRKKTPTVTTGHGG